MLNKSKLRSHMAANNDTQRTLAEALGISLSRLNAKINEQDGAEFKRNEIAFIKARYCLSPTAVDDIFFNKKMS